MRDPARAPPLLLSAGALLAATLSSAPPAHAQELTANVGLVEVAPLVSAPPSPSAPSWHAEHYALYPYAAVSTALPWGDVLLIPGIGIEVAPEVAHWGLVGTLVFDVPLNEVFGVDVVGALVHDQAGADFAAAVAFADAGVGVSLTLPGGFVVSPSLSAYQQLASAPALSIVPAVNVGWTP